VAGPGQGKLGQPANVDILERNLVDRANLAAGQVALAAVGDIAQAQQAALGRGRQREVDLELERVAEVGVQEPGGAHVLGHEVHTRIDELDRGPADLEVANIEDGRCGRGQ